MTAAEIQVLITKIVQVRMQHTENGLEVAALAAGRVALEDILSRVRDAELAAEKDAAQWIADRKSGATVESDL